MIAVDVPFYYPRSAVVDVGDAYSFFSLIFSHSFSLPHSVVVVVVFFVLFASSLPASSVMPLREI